MALYQKYRPQQFGDLVGQEAIKRTLVNALKSNTICHAYLFVGPRGTGKTTTARLMAKSLNCQQRQQGEFEPCNNCASCQEIASGQSLDVIEIDAASNRGIDDVRDLRDKIRYAPAKAKFKIFIIDEVHMLTKESFNALLKTLEEPPKHAIFIMATTEPQKILDTIISRVQEFDFKRATNKEIQEDLNKIIKAEKIKIEPEALELIVQAGDGSFRDAESILDQVNSLGEDKITLINTQQIMGIVADKITGDFVDLLIQDKPAKAIELIDHVHCDGYNLANFTNRIIEYLRSIMLTISGLNLQSAISEKEAKRIKSLANQVEPSKILAMITRFLQASQEMKNTGIQQIPLELAVYQLSVVSCQLSEVKNRESVVSCQLSEVKSQESDMIAPKRANKIPENHSNNSVIQNSDLQFTWLRLIEDLSGKNHSLALLVKDSWPIKIADDVLLVGVKFKFYSDRINDPKHYALLTESIENVFGRKLGIECEIQNSKCHARYARRKSWRAGKIQNAENKNNLVNEALDVFGE